MRALIAFAVALSASACSLSIDFSQLSGGDAGRAGDAANDGGDASTTSDGATLDVVDASTATDAGVDAAPPDSATMGDVVSVDSGTGDASPFDATAIDGDGSDSGVPDIGVFDAGELDTDAFDTGADTGVDTGLADAGMSDTGVTDAGVEDTGIADTGCEIDERVDQDPASGSAFAIESGTWQEVLVGRTGLLTQIALYSANGRTTSTTLTIRAGRGLGGSVLATQTVSFAAGDFAVYFSPGIPVTAGTSVTMEFTHTGLDDGVIYIFAAPGYPGAVHNIRYGGQDVWFRSFVTGCP